ncbi:hypothetical protein ACSSVY_001318 [Roseovarius sp. MBR-51]
MGCRTTDFLLSQSLRSHNSPPFIGLAPLKSKFRDGAVEKTQAFLGGSPSRLPNLFQSFPYVAAWCVTQALSDSYGETDHGIYRHIEDVLGISLETQQSRRMLFEGFCHVCDKLGLPSRGFDRMVDVYLLHAGVPVSHLPTIIEAFLRQEAAFGPTPIESTVLLNRWEDDSLEFVHPSIITPRRAILWDETAWHATLFARVREATTSFQPVIQFEERFAEVLAQRLNGRRSGTSQAAQGLMPVPKPRLTWRDGALSLRLARTEGRIQFWQDHETRPLRLRGGDDWMLPQPWPKHMRWQIGTQSGELTFLVASTGFAIFDRTTGYLVRDSEGARREIEVDASDAVILSRSSFSIHGEPALEAGAHGFIGFAKLGCVPVKLTTQDGETILRARPRRRLTLRDGIVVGGPRGPLYASSALLNVETGLDRTEKRYLRLIVGTRTADVEIETVNGFGETCLADLLKYLPEICEADPLRIRVELLAPVDGASPLRSAGISLEAWVWPGFRASNGLIFHSERPPVNLMEEQSRHAGRDDSGQLCLDPAGGYISARAVFEIESKFIPFDFPWPDVTVVRQRSDGTPIGLPTGTRLSVGEENRFDTITIRCPDADASLIVRGRQERRPFAHGLTRNLALRDLLMPASDDKVLLRRKSGAEVLLFELVPSLAPVAVQFLPASSAFRLHLRLSQPIDAIALDIADERGAVEMVEVGLGRRPVGGRQPSWLAASLINNDPKQIEISISLNDFVDGVSLARLLVRPDAQSDENSAWRPLRNSRGDAFALALQNPETETSVSLERIQRRFEVLSQWLADCFAPECWSQIERVLVPRWQTVGRALSALPFGRTSLMIAAAVPPPEHTAASWVPIAHPIQLVPDLYGGPVETFAALAASSDPGVVEMSALFTLTTARLRDLSHLHPTVFLAFRNRIAAMQNGQPLAGFEPKRFFKNIPLVDGDPSAGWFWRGTTLLGPDHWRAAFLRFTERLETAGLFTTDEADDGPNSRRQEALQRLIHAAWTIAPPDLRPPAPLRTSDAEEQSPIDVWTASTLSAYAKANRTGELPEFLSALRQQLKWSEADVLTSLAFLLRLAPELFAYFLLMWQIAKDRP